MEGINSLSSGYIAFVLQAESREEVLHRFPSRFEEIRAEHVTYLYGVNANTAMPAAGVLTVLAYVSDQSLEALIVSFNGETIRPDGSIFHLTLSKAAGRRSLESNRLACCRELWQTVEQFDLQTYSEFRLLQ